MGASQEKFIFQHMGRQRKFYQDIHSVLLEYEDIIGMQRKQNLKILVDFSSLCDIYNAKVDVQYEDFLISCSRALDVSLVAVSKFFNHAKKYLKERKIDNVKLVIVDSEHDLFIIQKNYSDINLFISKNHKRPKIIHGMYCCSIDFDEIVLDAKKESFVEIAKEKLLYTIFSDKYELIIDKNTENECRFLKKIFDKNGIYGGRILDCFCGCGRHDSYLNSYGFVIDGVDISEQQIENARKNSHSSQNRYYICDIRDFDIEENMYDLSICMWTSFNYLSNPSDMEHFLTKVAQGLKDKGLFILDTKNFYKDKDYKVYLKNVEDDELSIKILVIKEIRDDIQNSRYLYFMYNKDIGQSQFLIDKEVIKIYRIDELIKYIDPLFKIKEIYGDFKFANYEKDKSDRMILILEKK